ncbi:unnamed protein product, partial [Mesorhabditis spiculigera]
MGSTEEATNPVDNIVERKQCIIDRIDAIQKKKQVLLEKLKMLKEMGKPDMVQLCLSAYDTLDEQEKSYMELLVDVVEIHQNATEDFAKEPLPLMVESKDDDNLNLSIEEMKQQIADIQQKTIDAAIYQQKLQKELGSQRDNQSSFSQIQSKLNKDSKENARSAYKDLESMKVRVFGERQENDRKQKQLERMRKKISEKEEKGEAEEKPVEAEDGDKSAEDLVKERRKHVEELVKVQREQQSKVSDRLRSGLEALGERRKQMETIHNMLERIKQLDKEISEAPSTSTTDVGSFNVDKDIDPMEQLENTYADAQSKLMNLSSIRERLEQYQQSIKDKQNENAEEAEQAAKFLDSLSISNDEPQKDDELTSVVRNLFEDSMASQRSTVKDTYANEFAKIHRTLAEHSVALAEIRQKLLQPEPIDSLSETIRSRPPHALRAFSAILLRLADGHQVPKLANYVDSFLRGSEESSSVDEDEDENEEDDEDEDEMIGSLILANPQIVEAARKELASPQEKERKERTLNRVRLQLDEKENEEHEPDTAGIEAIMAIVCSQIRQLMGSMEEVDAEGIERISTTILSTILQWSSSTLSKKISEDIRMQLEPLITDSLAEFTGQPANTCAENLLYVLSEMVYNELAFYKLLHSLHNLTDSPNE